MLQLINLDLQLDPTIGGKNGTGNNGTGNNGTNGKVGKNGTLM